MAKNTCVNSVGQTKLKPTTLLAEQITPGGSAEHALHIPGKLKFVFLVLFSVLVVPTTLPTLWLSSLDSRNLHRIGTTNSTRVPRYIYYMLIQHVEACECIPLRPNLPKSKIVPSTSFSVHFQDHLFLTVLSITVTSASSLRSINRLSAITSPAAKELFADSFPSKWAPLRKTDSG